MGSAGPIGLDYNVLFSLMNRMNLSEQDFDYLFNDVRVIESTALTILNTKDDK